MTYCPKCKSSRHIITRGYDYTQSATEIAIHVSTLYTEFCCLNCDARWRPIEGPVEVPVEAASV